MSRPAIRVENLGKQYRLGLTHAGTIRELASRWTGKLLRRPDPAPGSPPSAPGSPPPAPGSPPSAPGSPPSALSSPTFWALKDVSFEVQPGEVLGIIGRNGAGKSTLLKILSRVTSPTTGRIELNGRVASLLEIGTGFHPELTGRENVFLNGTILGMTKAEVRRKFDEIVAFAEIEKFIDTPVKRYSSGMNVRLGFAVAAHLEPEILVVDEVLAVGDVSFQRKCLGKMEDVAQHGRTVLFVSHQMPAVESLTQRCLLLEQGGIDLMGETTKVVSRYVERSTGDSERPISEWSDRHGNRETAIVTGFSALNRNGERTRFLPVGEPFTLEIEVDYTVPTMADVAVVVENARSVPLFTSALSDGQRLEKRAGTTRYAVTIDPNCLKLGAYLVTICVSSAASVYHDLVLHYPAFRIHTHSDAEDIPCDNRWGDLVFPFTWQVG